MITLSKHNPLALPIECNFIEREKFFILKSLEAAFFHISMIGGYRFLEMWESRILFRTFPSIVRKLWEKPDAFPGFFHDFPQYGISIKHDNES